VHRRTYKKKLRQIDIAASIISLVYLRKYYGVQIFSFIDNTNAPSGPKNNDKVTQVNQTT
jgi:hypothetical protein